jgi:hypothetical protein
MERARMREPEALVLLKRAKVRGRAQGLMRMAGEGLRGLGRWWRVRNNVELKFEFRGSGA